MRRSSTSWGWLLALLTGVMSLPGLAHASELGTSYESLELTPLIQEALTQNPEVVAAREQIQAMEARIPQARALEDPEFKVQLWNTPENLDVTRTDTTIYGLAQRFPFPGTLSLQEQIAVEGAGQAVQRLTAKEREIIEAVKSAYYELFYAQMAVDIHHERVKLLKQFFQIANSRFRVGKGTPVDVLKAQVELSTLLQHLPLLEQRLLTARAHLNTLLNRDPSTPLGMPRKPIPTPLRTSLEQLHELALRQRPELQEADTAVAEAESATKLAKLQYFPKLRVEVQRWQNFNTNDGFGGNVTLNLPFSFWTKSKYDAGVREASARVGVLRAKQHALMNETRFLVSDLLAQIEASHKIVSLYATTVLPQANETRQAALAGYRTGKVDFLDLIEADRAVITYQLEYYRALADLAGQEARLERVVGGPL